MVVTMSITALFIAVYYSLLTTAGGSCSTDVFGDHVLSCSIIYKSIEECDILTYDNHDNGSYLNTCGGYNCSCKPDFIDDGTTDMDKCVAEEHSCHINATCINESGSYYCMCLDGFVGNGTDCLDVDECHSHLTCHDNASCHNTIGSFYCTCDEGFEGDGNHCIDIYECDSIWAYRDNATCHNTIGSYYYTCAEGFEGDGNICIDLNECMEENLSCHINATCINIPRSYYCMCADGFVGNGYDCVDTDECDSNLMCHDNAICHNTIGSFYCTCAEGFNGDSNNCTEIDECAGDSHSCHINATCINTPGSYYCMCLDGFLGNGSDCLATSTSTTGPKDAACVDSVSATCCCKDGILQSNDKCESEEFAQINNLKLNAKWNSAYLNKSSPALVEQAKRIENVMFNCLTGDLHMTVISVQVIKLAIDGVHIDVLIIYPASSSTNASELFPSLNENFQSGTDVTATLFEELKVVSSNLPTVTESNVCKVQLPTSSDEKVCIALEGMTFRCECKQDYKLNAYMENVRKVIKNGSL